MAQGCLVAQAAMLLQSVKGFDATQLDVVFNEDDEQVEIWTYPAPPDKPAYIIATAAYIGW